MIRKMTWLCLGAGQGTRLRPITDDRPKPMVPVCEKPLIEWLQRTATAAGIDTQAAVTGYRGEMLDRPGLDTYRNEQYDETNMVESLWCAEQLLHDPIVVSYGDILYTQDVLETLPETDADVAVAIDTDWRRYWEQRHEDPTDDAESLQMTDDGTITSIGQPIESASAPEAQYIGLMAFSANGVDWLRETYHRLDDVDTVARYGRSRDNLFMTDLLQAMIDEGYPVTGVEIDGGWVEIDTPHDLEIARQVCQPTADGTLDIDRDRYA